ncbi:undecaprenyl-phosphate glucose phosphotransferase [Agitococcus lubricus]|uniref:Putative colanic acid biosynthesis UDP-glucose lipid carrier transferase n=1 Tax=Agitococcus lubricus TaxID=1077255 RepID=A0A2T5J0C5_9GAMM|nr:undecaprenyl-phosphate glucose phosphotransferase [Agitococcus lubricus]PTQ89765.1 putative colanic acid biosynthesis UDP-glucose lipid carrier transferase [Agitococcus lubricus]
MQATPSILSPHHKLLDFMNRLADIFFLGLALSLTLTQLDKSWGQSATLLLLFSIVYYQLAAALIGIYGSQRSIKVREQMLQTLLALAGTFALVAMTSNLSNRLHFLADREFLLFWVILSALLLTAWRLTTRVVLTAIRQHGINTRKAAIVGCNALGRSLVQRFHNNRWMGIDPVAFYDDHADSTTIDGITVHGRIADVLEDARYNKFDRIYITLPMSEQASIKQLIDGLADSTTNVFLVPDVFVFDLMNSRQTSIDGLPAISIYDTPFSFADSVVKRGFDIFAGLGILSIIALPMLVIAVAVKMTSKGPIVFKQIRYGLDGKPIEVWKFRSMTTMDNGNVVKQATKGDSRITPLGAFLRRTSLDELPQFINVLQGQMSIVGPRPHAVAHNEEYRKLIKGYMLRHKVKPGITGWAQINGWRGETDTLDKMEKRVEYDLAYIRNWTVWLDIKIVFLTVFKGFINKNAY